MEIIAQSMKFYKLPAAVPLVLTLHYKMATGYKSLTIVIVGTGLLNAVALISVVVVFLSCKLSLLAAILYSSWH